MNANAVLSAAHPRRWLILFILLAVEAMDLLDSTIVNVAVPTISADLGSSETALQWIVGGYALTYSVGLVTGGRLGDIFGRRRMFVVGAVGFTIASLACGLAPSTGVLIALRLVQGLFAAIMIPQGFGIIRQVFPPDEMTKAFSLFGPVIALGAILGPVLGGLLTDADLFGTQWRMIFLINLPLGILAVIGALRVLPESRGEKGLTLDVRGSATIVVAATLLIYPLIQGREQDWPWWCFAMMAAGVALFVVFGLLERAADRPGHTPIVTPSLFTKKAFTSGVGITALFFAGIGGILLVQTLYLQLGRHYSAVHAGLTLIPWSLGTGIGAGLGAGLLAPRIGRHVMHIGLALMAGSVLWMHHVIGAAGAGISTWDLAGPQLLLGAGMGMVIAPLFGTILAGVDDDEVGSGSGVLNAMQQLGSAIGVAVMGTIFFSAIGSAGGFVDGFQKVLVIELGCIGALALLAFLLPLRPRSEEEMLATQLAAAPA